MEPVRTHRSLALVVALLHVCRTKVSVGCIKLLSLDGKTTIMRHSTTRIAYSTVDAENPKLFSYVRQMHWQLWLNAGLNLFAPCQHTERFPMLLLLLPISPGLITFSWCYHFAAHVLLYPVTNHTAHNFSNQPILSLVLPCRTMRTGWHGQGYSVSSYKECPRQPSEFARRR